MKATRNAGRLRSLLAALAASITSSCASVALEPGTSLTSYGGMTKSGGTMTKAELRVDPSQVLSAKTIRIVPTALQLKNAAMFDPRDLMVVANAVDRALCTDLSDRFVVVAANQPSDLVVHAAITDIIATNRTAAATSTVMALGTTAVLPVPMPRLPIGLGGLAIEAEAVDAAGAQRAAMLWSRGANMITSRARVSKTGDAYSLSSAFASDFSTMLIRGRDPFKAGMTMPSMQKMKATLGGEPKYAACKAFGTAPGLKGIVASPLGLPPTWTDSGANPAK